MTNAAARTATVARVLALAEGSYSEDHYANWPAVASLLLARGYSEKEAAAIMKSKWTRWAGDASPAAYGKVPASALAAFLDDPRNRCTPAAVAELVEGTF